MILSSTLLEWGPCGFGVTGNQFRLGLVRVTWMSGSFLQKILRYESALLAAWRKLALVVERQQQRECALDIALPESMSLIRKCHAAIEMANDTGWPVAFRHDGAPLVAMPGDNAGLLADGFAAAAVEGQRSP